CLSGLAIARWMWLPTEVATAIDSESGFCFSCATRSCTFLNGESARTATSMDSSSSRAMGVISAYDKASGCSTRALIMPVLKVPSQCASPGWARRVCRPTAPLPPGLFEMTSVWSSTFCCSSSRCSSRAAVSRAAPGPAGTTNSTLCRGCHDWACAGQPKVAATQAVHTIMLRSNAFIIVSPCGRLAGRVAPGDGRPSLSITATRRGSAGLEHFPGVLHPVAQHVARIARVDHIQHAELLGGAERRRDAVVVGFQPRLLGRRVVGGRDLVAVRRRRPALDGNRAPARRGPGETVVEPGEMLGGVQAAGHAEGAPHDDRHPRDGGLLDRGQHPHCAQQRAAE